ncbi:LysR family transcriptional regulator [Variovorax sp. KK3]|uniref:LysR family transcriptional regulator n=1 Tax=Variovorax sp. KK3 TaxID=1855728 RepID=UPI00211794C6|nr:LysR family transcriptional regulator [Variovorax sp. KK3]
MTTKAQAALNARRVDLNLLRVFDAIFEDRNLLRAGKRLHLSQSAISHALARLREALQDELFVRTPKGMEPTARALAMEAPLREALRRIHDTLGVQDFDAATTTQRFVVAANDYMTSVLLARLGECMAQHAPAADLVVRPSTRLDLAEQLDVGRIDVALGIFAEVPARFQSARLWQQDDVLVFRRGHPLARRKPRIDDLAAFPLLTVSLGGQEEGAVSGFILERGLARQSEMFDRSALEEALAAAGLQPRYRLTVPHSLAVPDLLANSDMVSIVPAPLAQSFVARRELLSKALPYATQHAVVRAVWHRRHEHDPAHVWLREQLMALSKPFGE